MLTSAHGNPQALETHHADTARWTSRLAWVVLASSIVRLAFASVTGLGVDESYAAAVARPFSLSYFDHPPLHFWMVGAMIELTGDTRAFVLRLPFILCFSATLLMIGKLGMQLFGPRAGVIGAVVLAITAVPGITSGTWVLPDGPLLLGTSAAALLLAPMLVGRVAPTGLLDGGLHPDASNQRMRWSAAAAAIAVALLSKYHAVLFVAALFLYALTVPRARLWLRTQWPWTILIIAVLAAVPVLWWNASHEWASLGFQSARATTARAWSLAPFLENVAGQAAWLLPWNAPLLFVALVSAWYAGPRDPARWYCAVLASGPVVLFTAITLTGARGLPHWQSPGWMFAAPLVGSLLDRALTASARWPRRWLSASTAATCVLVLVVASHTATGWLSPLLIRAGASPDPTLDALDWRPLADTLRARGLQGARVYAPSWIQAGKLGVALGAQARVDCACDDAHHFAYRRVSGDSVVAQSLLVEHVQSWRKQWQPASITMPSRLGPLDSLFAVPIQRAGRDALTLVVYRSRLKQQLADD